MLDSRRTTEYLKESLKSRTRNELCLEEKWKLNKILQKQKSLEKYKKQRLKE